MSKIKIVVATRATKDEFFNKTALGQSLAVYRLPFLEICLFPENKHGLPKIYNEAIERTANDPSMLIFAHDDIHILDFYWIGTLYRVLEKFQILGLTGNKRRLPRQPSWAFVDTKFTWDQPENLSGVVGHGKGFPPINVSGFGPSEQQVKLLDGLFLCSYSQTLHEKKLRFDERFDFHFYDMDFCRQAEQKGVTCGTCPLTVIHESGGSFGSPGWVAGYQKYLEKWKD